MRYSSILILTGAGVSAESGLKTFRGEDGWWQNYRVEELATTDAFGSNPELVQRFYNSRRQQLLSGGIAPNAAHHALRRLELQSGGSFVLVTQNIDDLHERAGSVNLIHMHGELLKQRCHKCGNVDPVRQDIRVTDVCDSCAGVGSLRPHVVWFGETPLQMDQIYHRLDSCDLFVAIGTSGNVYPAAGFAQIAAAAGAHTVEFNLEPSMVENVFTQKIYGPATRTVPQFVDDLC